MGDGADPARVAEMQEGGDAWSRSGTAEVQADAGACSCGGGSCTAISCSGGPRLSGGSVAHMSCSGISSGSTSCGSTSGGDIGCDSGSGGGDEWQ